MQNHKEPQVLKRGNFLKRGNTIKHIDNRLYYRKRDKLLTSLHNYLSTAESKTEEKLQVKNFKDFYQ